MALFLSPAPLLPTSVGKNKARDTQTQPWFARTALLASLFLLVALATSISLAPTPMAETRLRLPFRFGQQQQQSRSRASIRTPASSRYAHAHAHGVCIRMGTRRPPLGSARSRCFDSIAWRRIRTRPSLALFEGRRSGFGAGGRFKMFSSESEDVMPAPEEEPVRRGPGPTIAPDPEPPLPEGEPIEIDVPEKNKELPEAPDSPISTTKNETQTQLEPIAEPQFQNLTQVLAQLEAIMVGELRNITMLGSRHCSPLDQRVIELVAYALILTGNHIYTSGGMGTNYVSIRGALRAFDSADLKGTRLSVILPQTVEHQPQLVQETLKRVHDVTELGYNDLPLDKASRLCNSALIDKSDELMIFAYHNSNTVLDCAKEAREKNKIVTIMYLD